MISPLHGSVRTEAGEEASGRERPGWWVQSKALHPRSEEDIALVLTRGWEIMHFGLGVVGLPLCWFKCNLTAASFMLYLREEQATQSQPLELATLCPERFFKKKHFKLQVQTHQKTSAIAPHPRPKPCPLCGAPFFTWTYSRLSNECDPKRERRVRRHTHAFL